MGIGDTIRSARERLGWSQAEFARRLGVSRAAVGHWEAGMTAPTRKRAERVAKELGISLREISPASVLGLEVIDLDQSTITLKLMELSSFSEFALQNLEAIQDVMPVLSAYLAPSQVHIALRVDREEMHPEIRAGDIVVAAVNAAPIANDVVLATVGGQVLMRRFVPRGPDSGRFEAFDLVSPNPDLPTVTVNSSNPGKVLATVVQHHRMMSR